MANSPERSAKPAPLSGSAPDGLNESLPARSRIISPSLLLPAEAVVFELKPSLWYVLIVSLPITAAGVGLVLLACLVEEVAYVWRHWALVLGIWAVGLRIAVGFLQWLGCTYVLTDRRILKQSGVVNVCVRCVGLEEIESTFVAQAAFQRAVGIGTIFFRCGGREREAQAWEHVRQPKKVHGRIVLQIERWKQARSMREGE